MEKYKIRLNGNKKHSNLIKRVKKESYLVKEGILSVRAYLSTNRFYFGINIG